jgi:hypothetical protein
MCPGPNCDRIRSHLDRIWIATQNQKLIFWNSGHLLVLSEVKRSQKSAPIEFQNVMILSFTVGKG